MKDTTVSIHTQIERSQYREHSTALYMTSSFVYESAEQAAALFAKEEEGYMYSRFHNPNTTELIAKYCRLENASHGVATASGMAANFYTMAAHLQQGDHIVACTSLFGNSLYILNNILPTWGIEVTLVDPLDYDHWASEIKSNTKMLFLETPTNPGLEIIDLERIAVICKSNDVLLAVDNCFATPILQKPINFGADIVIHSATKWSDGQGRVLGGVVVGREEVILPIDGFLRRTGASMSPFNAWTISKSLETLSVRMERHSANALQLAIYLQSNDKIKQVRYPFLKSHPQHKLAQKQMTQGGGIVTIDVIGGRQQAYAVINALQIPNITANLGDTRSIVTHPATTTHSRLSQSDREKANIWESTIRISVGLEDIDELIADFARSLQVI